jgi:hypothetical protein
LQALDFIVDRCHGWYCRFCNPRQQSSQSVKKRPWEATVKIGLDREVYRWQRSLPLTEMFTADREVYRWQRCLPLTEKFTADRDVYRWQRSLPLTEMFTADREVYRWHRCLPLPENFTADRDVYRCQKILPLRFRLPLTENFTADRRYHGISFLRVEFFSLIKITRLIVDVLIHVWKTREARNSNFCTSYAVFVFLWEQAFWPFYRSLTRCPCYCYCYCSHWSSQSHIHKS